MGERKGGGKQRNTNRGLMGTGKGGTDCESGEGRDEQRGKWGDNSN